MYNEATSASGALRARMWDIKNKGKNKPIVLNAIGLNNIKRDIDEIKTEIDVIWSG